MRHTKIEAGDKLLVGRKSHDVVSRHLVAPELVLEHARRSVPDPDSAIAAARDQLGAIGAVHRVID
jgi:signal transduction histidine kinase